MGRIYSRLGETTSGESTFGQNDCYVSFRAGPDATEGDTTQLHLASVNLKTD